MDHKPADGRSQVTLRVLSGLPSDATHWGWPVDNGQNLIMVIGENRRVEAVRLDLGSGHLMQLLDGSPRLTWTIPGMVSGSPMWMILTRRFGRCAPMDQKN